MVTPTPTEENPEPEPIEVHRFELYDAQRDLYICKDCLPVYNELEPIAMEYPHLTGMPELRASLLAKVPNPEFGFLKKLLPGQSF
jgi:hypothetical protein